MSEFIELPKSEIKVNTKIVNQEKLNLDIKDFIENDIIIINSGTATGKTRQIGKISRDLKKQIKDLSTNTKSEYHFLSIVNLISLAREQINTFKQESLIIDELTNEESYIKLNNYQSGVKGLNENDAVICINSLYKLAGLDEYDYKNKIVYIDEINDLLKSLTHNDGMDKVLRLIYEFLIQLIKSCKKIILSDATIDDNVFNLLSCRKENNKTILIKNVVKKFENIKATNFNNENEFINKLRDCIKNKKYFLFGCDGCRKITKMYLKLIDEFKEQKEDFKIYTREQFERIDNATIEFKGKYVFYSPSIKTGVSFVLKDIKQPQFIYLTQNPQIDPESLYQMSCRTRNMSELNLYLSEIKQKKMPYNSLKDCEDSFRNFTTLNDRLMSLSVSRNDEDDKLMVNNTFFKLFCYNEYKNDVFFTGYKQHYINLLKKDGFIIEEKGEIKNIEKEAQQDIDINFDLFNETKFEEFLKIYYEPKDEEDMNQLDKKYKILNTRLNLLNIPTIEEAIKYKNFITDEYLLTDYFQTLNLFKEESYIKKKLIKKKEDCFAVKNVSNIYSKIRLLSIFEHHYKIERFNLDFNLIDETNEIKEEFKSMYKFNYPRLIVKTYKTKKDLLKIYVNMIKSITGDAFKFINYKYQKVKGTQKTELIYFINKEIMKELIILAKYKNPLLKEYNLELIEKYTGIKPEQKKNKYDYVLVDEDDAINDYKFNRTIKL